jgi:outer membrane lipoprotein LolB
MRKRDTLLAVVSISLMLAGCSLQPIEEAQEPLISALGAPVEWRATGRFSYSGESERQSGQFDWQQQGPNYQVRLFGPLGMGSIKIVGSEHEVEIESGDQSYVSNDPDLLFYELTSMHIPIKELSRWMTGIVEDEPLNREWQIIYDDYLSVGEHFLPTRIDIEKDLSSMRIAVSEWSLELVE